MFPAHTMGGRRLPKLLVNDGSVDELPDISVSGTKMGTIKIPNASDYWEEEEEEEDDVEEDVYPQTQADCPPLGFMDSGPTTATGYDLDNEYDYIMKKAMTSYLSHRDEEKEPGAQGRCLSATPNKQYQPARKFFARRPVQSARLPPKIERVETVPPTVSLDLEPSASYTINTPLSLRSGGNAESLRPKRRPLTASVIRYPITGQRMSNSNGKRLPKFKSASEHTTPTKMNLGGGSGSGNKGAGGYEYQGGFFVNNRRTRRDFIIHPDWVSESLTVEKLSLNKRKGYPPLDYRYATFPMRRCKSAPPPRARNPITWAE